MKFQSRSQPPARKAANSSLFCLVFALGILILLRSSPTFAGGVVTNCTEAALRAAMAGGGTVTFACDGTITLAGTITNDVSLTLDGRRHQVTISGGYAVRVFQVNANVTLTLINLTVARGASVTGAGVFNNGGTLNATHCTFSGNGFFSTGANSKTPAGGAIYNAGTVSAWSCVFSNNSLQGDPGLSGQGPGPVFPPGAYGCAANGGAVFNAGSFTARACGFLENSAVGGVGGAGGNAHFPTPGIGGYGGNGGGGCGGALYNLGTISVESSLFRGNWASGGNGGRGGLTVNVPATSYSGGNGGSAGDGAGGAVFNSGTAALVNCTLTGNQGNGGGGGAGGSAQNNPGSSGYDGYGGNGGSGFGAVSGNLSMTNCTIAFNAGYKGADGPGYPRTPGSEVACGGIGASRAILVNTLLANNVGGNCSGTLADLGHNISSDGTCAFTNTGSLNGADAKICSLTNNGGPTLTIALLPGSPAIDAADSSAAPPTDQRGFPRPAGSAADIGAFEYGSMMPVLNIARPSANALNIIVQGNSNQWCRLLVSSNLADWIPLATNQIGSAGTVTFQESWNPSASRRFYRVVMP